MQEKPKLKIGWATHDAAKYACENWHYSKCTPVGKTVKIGVWENEQFIGVVIYGRGANRNMLAPFGLSQDQGVELVRVALSKHLTPVSKIISISFLFLKKLSPSLRLVVSYADPCEGHYGGIYQAGNWLYTGLSGTAVKVWYRGKWTHKKTIDDLRINQTNLNKKRVPGKHRYLMPLDEQMKKRILPLSKPYPKRVSSVESGTTSFQEVGGGESPTDTLQITNKND